MPCTSPESKLPAFVFTDCQVAGLVTAHSACVTREIGCVGGCVGGWVGGVGGGSQAIGHKLDCHVDVTDEGT